MFTVDDTLYFVTHQRDSGNVLWKSDGSEVGTLQVKQLLTDAIPPVDLQFGDKGLLYFSMMFPTETGTRYELWRSDGTEAGTTLLKDVHMAWMATINNVVYFHAFGYELWRGDTIPGPELLVKDIYTGTESSEPGYEAALLF
jgi:ELWxxDGT repeat protein